MDGVPLTVRCDHPLPPCRQKHCGGCLITPAWTNHGYNRTYYLVLVAHVIYCNADYFGYRCLFTQIGVAIRSRTCSDAVEPSSEQVYLDGNKSRWCIEQSVVEWGCMHDSTAAAPESRQPERLQTKPRAAHFEAVCSGAHWQAFVRHNNGDARKRVERKSGSAISVG